ncbi:MAG: hypothetical protein SH807_10640 [Blastochloris sp.]|nr:hypothetical protein [Blastochloris sp.]
MPKISLVVCLYKERDFLERLLRHAEGCYDDLVVVHDGREEKDESGKVETLKSKILYGDGWKSPEELSLKEPQAPPIELAQDYADLPADSPMPTGYRLATGNPRIGSIHELVVKYGGRFYEGPRCYQQEPHWPFAWWAAKHEWILRLDADEFPSKELKKWLEEFRDTNAEKKESGYLGIWPLWDGYKELWVKNAPNRLFLFNKKNASFFGMAENSPSCTCITQGLDFLIHHRPRRKSYGLGNLLIRKQSYRWLSVISNSLLKSPSDLPRWNYKEEIWPEFWERVRRAPLLTGLTSGLLTPVRHAVHVGRRGAEFLPIAYIGMGLHHMLMCLFFFLRRRNVM